MTILSLSLSNFRSFKKTQFQFDGKVTFIVGPNASGKTTILESLSILSTGKGFRTDSDRELISFEKEVARVEGNMRKLDDESEKLEIVLTGGEVMGVKTPLKRYQVNGVPKRYVDFAGNFISVLFWPEHLELVTDSPSLRRRYLDSVLVQTDREYRRELSSYERGVRQRNRLLEAVRDSGANPKQLDFWNQLLIKSGTYIHNKREEFFNFVNRHVEKHTENGKFDSMPLYSLTYDHSIISDERLFKYKDAEIASANTLVGPHRDNFIFNIKMKNGNFNDLSKFGSRGEQRLGVLWLKLSELSYIETEAQEKPVLLLDDIFSELDKSHQYLVMEMIRNNQSVITTIDPSWAEKVGNRDASVIKLME